ncbi:DUF397 domain-containing protein [Stackebrandtia nassauensis]|uniref:DUF397 domain-containing protein n=1 Tax=Stackebrandtia nassauensis TaxID=283811 RepID=UPI000A00A84E
MTYRPSSWRRSSRSGTNTNNNCVEVRLDGRTPQVSDSQFVGRRPIVELDRTDYLAFLATVKSDL